MQGGLESGVGGSKHESKNLPKDVEAVLDKHYANLDIGIDGRASNMIMK